MSPLLRVGNDVVDLSAPRARGRATDRRLVERVLAPAERDAVARADSPDRALWIRWAAKEAAFKVVSKERGAPPPFVHAAFQVSVDARGAAAAPGGVAVRGRVRYQDHLVPFAGEVRAGRVHLLAWSGGGAEPPPEAAWGLAAREGPPPASARFSDRERSAIHSAASAWVRIEARRAIATALSVDEDRLEIVCGDGPPGRTPPLVLLDGTPSGVDVSLSHDGPWVAWAMRRSVGPPSSAAPSGPGRGPP